MVKWLFEHAAAVRTPAEIADDANANGRTKARTARQSGKAFGGNLWTARQVIATLRNPVYLGQFGEKQDFGIGHYDPILKHELFAAGADQLEARRTREPGVRYLIDWPLKGRIVCAACERLMSPQRSGTGACFTVIIDAGRRPEAGRRAGIRFQFRRLRIPSR